jgi:hypothetical protein
MRRLVLLVLTALLVATAALAQTAPTDSQTLQALLAEVRQLRHDLQTTTATTQRAQIALYRLQRQDEAVARATQRVTDARSKLADVASEKNKKLVEIQGAKAAASHLDTPGAQTHFEEVVLPGLESQLEMLRKDEQQARARESEAEQRVRDEQTKLDGLNDLAGPVEYRLGGGWPKVVGSPSAGVRGSHPFDFAQGRLFRKKRERMGHLLWRWCLRRSKASDRSVRPFDTLRAGSTRQKLARLRRPDGRGRLSLGGRLFCRETGIQAGN